MNVLLTALLTACIAVNCAQSAAVPRGTDLEQSRPQTAVLEAAAEGETERLPATLYEFSVQTGYYGGVNNRGMCGGSLYLPDEGWTKAADGLLWRSEENSRVTLRIGFSDNPAAWMARQMVTVQNPDYTFTELDETNRFSGTDGGGMAMDVSLAATPAGTWVLLKTYPVEATGLGAQLEAICASFEPLPEPERPDRERVFSFGGEVSAALYRGEGYTLYIPETNWRRTEDPARRETVWTSAEDSRAWFSVRAFPGLGGQEDLPALRREMERAYPRRTFAAGTPDQDPFVLWSVDNALVVMVRFYQLGEDAYAVTRWHPNDKEGTGTDIFAITGTFRLTGG